MDGCDFAIAKGRDKWLFKTHKKVKNKRAMRAQVLIDVRDNKFRGFCVSPAGMTNDQGMLLSSEWNGDQFDFVNEGQHVLTDSGYSNSFHYSFPF